MSKNTKDNYFSDLVKLTDNKFASLAADGIEAGDINGFISTGSFMLNAILSGSIYGGLPDNKITAIAGEEATGKTFIVLDMCKHFLDSNPENGVLYFETESALTKQMLEERNIDTKRLYIIPVTTIQEFRTQILKVLEKYLTQSKSERKPIMFVLDSLGMLSTTKEMEDSVAGAETRDMTRAALVKAAFRTITLKLGRAGVPLIVTNHTYDEQGKMYAQKVMCLDGATEILTDKNELIQIKNVKIGDKVKTLTGYDQVINVYSYETEELYEIEFEDGYKIQCTEEHKFLTKDLQWIEACNLIENDEIVLTTD